MYESYYSFSAMPFQLTPDSRFFFGSQEHSKAMAFLQYGIGQREGFIVITGEIGAGKTTLVEHLLSTLDPSAYVTARLVTTQLGGYDTLCMIGNAFGVYREGMDKAALIARLRLHFADLQARRVHPLVIIDEAQSLTTEAIEELRMLSNLSFGSQAPFQGIFLGQPEFRSILSSPQLQQFRQRVIVSNHLGALNADDTRRYIEHRLAHVGWANDPSFTDTAFQEIYKHTGGIPRRVNTLCSRLLLLGYLEERHTIDGPDVVNVATELAVELGPLTSDPTGRSVLTNGLDTGGTLRDSDGILTRLDRIERATNRHDKVINHVLSLVLKYLPER